MRQSPRQHSRYCPECLTVVFPSARVLLLAIRRRTNHHIRNCFEKAADQSMCYIQYIELIVLLRGGLMSVNCFLGCSFLYVAMPVGGTQRDLGSPTYSRWQPDYLTLPATFLGPEGRLSRTDLSLLARKLYRTPRKLEQNKNKGLPDSHNTSSIYIWDGYIWDGYKQQSYRM